MPRPFKHDQWAPLSFAASVGDGTTRPTGARTWMDDDDARRVAAYERLAAYLDNVARYFMPDYLWTRPPADPKTHMSPPAPAEKRREYGDPALLVDQARSFVLGDEQTAVIPDAEPVAEDADTAEVAAQERAALFADWLGDWVEQETLWLRLLEGEEHAVGLGDAVYELVWDGEDGVPRLEVHDPGFYFPVLTGQTASRSGRYPNRIHLAWEEIDQETGTHWLYRKTYSRERLPDGETRRYRYQDPGDEPSAWTVFYTSAKFDLSKTKGDNLYDLSESAAVYDVDLDGTPLNRKDLFLDFIPVVHEPNDAAGRRHFGRSVLLRVAQLLDELADADTDLSANSADLGSPPVVLQGMPAQPGGLAVGPGAQWFTGEGDAKLLDTSRALDAQIKYVEKLLSRLSRNSRLAAALLGDVSPNEVPSGVALQLGFAPTTNLIREMRMVRTDKLPLIPKFAMRMAQQFQPREGVEPVLPDGATPRAEIRFGGFLPADKSAGLDRVTAALEAHAISTLTAVQELVEDGWAIEDAQEEVGRINGENFDAAVKLLEALGSEQAVAEYLGRDLADLTDVAGAGDGADGAAE